MASPIQTEGFVLRAQPHTDFIDGRLLAPRYGDIIPGISQGLTFYDQLQTLPMKRRLGQIELQEAQNRLDMAPLDRQLAQARLSEALQNATVPRILPGDIAIEDQTKVYPAAFDEAGNRTGPDDRVVGDLVEVKQEQMIGPGGVITPRTVRRTLKTAAEREAQEAKEAASLEATKALAAERGRGKQFESTMLIDLYNNAVDAGDAEAASLYKARIDKLNQPPGILPSGTAYNRRIEQLAADAGVTLDAAKQLAQTAEGAELLAKAAVANKAQARSFLPPTISATERQQLRAPGGGTYDDSVTEILTRGREAAPTFGSIAEAEAAAARGQIKPGQKIIVGGRSATWQE